MEGNNEEKSRVADPLYLEHKVSYSALVRGRDLDPTLKKFYPGKSRAKSVY
jgi:hypothetical protein